MPSVLIEKCVGKMPTKKTNSSASKGKYKAVPFATAAIAPFSSCFLGGGGGDDLTEIPLFFLLSAIYKLSSKYTYLYVPKLSIGLGWIYAHQFFETA